MADISSDILYPGSSQVALYVAVELGSTSDAGKTVNTDSTVFHIQEVPPVGLII